MAKATEFIRVDKEVKDALRKLGHTGDSYNKNLRKVLFGDK